MDYEIASHQKLVDVSFKVSLSCLWWLIWLTGLATDSIFFLFPVCKKIIDLPGGKINDPSSGKHYSLPFLAATPSPPSWTLEGLFELTRRPSQALDSPSALLAELQRYKTPSSVPRYARRSQDAGKNKLIQTLIVHLLKMCSCSKD